MRPDQQARAGDTLAGPATTYDPTSGRATSGHATTGPAIVARDLGRRYGNVVAVDSLSFEVASGEFFALLGPNGAGKTTTLHMLTTLVRPSEGRATVAGHDVVNEAAAVRRNLGMVFQDPALDDRLTARE